MNKNCMTQLLVETLACFCVDFLYGQWECCLNLPWIGDWIPRHLMPIDNKFVKETMLDNWDGDMSFGTKGDDLAAKFEIADNFVVNVKIGNVEGVDFYLICCSKPLHTIKEDFFCKRGINFVVGEQVVVGKCHKKWGTSYSTYVLLKNSHVVFLYSHLVHEQGS